MENVLIIQNDPAFLQEDGDLARLVACRHSFNKTPDLMSRRVIFKPFMVDNLNVISVPVEDGDGDRNVDVWIDITLGVYPDTEPIEGPVKIGENLTLSIYVKDSANNTDVRVKDCYAYDNIKSAKNNIKPSQLQLSEENGCPLRENLMSVWRRTTNTMDTGATMIAFNNLKAFKFPEKDSVFLACNIDLCRENCTERCELEPQNPDEEPPMSEQENGDGNEPQPEQGLGSDYEDPNNVGGFRGSIATSRKGGNQRPDPQRPGPQQARNRNQQPPVQPQRNRQGNQQQPSRNRQQPPQQQPPQQRNRNQPQRPQQRQPSRNGGPQQPPTGQQQPPLYQRGRNRQPQPGTSSFNVIIKHQQKQLNAQLSQFDRQSNPQSIEQSNNGPPDVIEQQANQSQGSIARSRPQGRSSKNARTIGRPKKGLFGPPQQFAPQQSSRLNYQTQQKPSNNNALQQTQPLAAPKQASLYNNLLPLPAPDLNSQQVTPAPQQQIPQQSLQSEPLRQPLANIQTNDLQPSSSSGQMNKVSAPQRPNRQRARKVIRKRAKAGAFLDKNSLPLASPDTLMSSASESIESKHSDHYSHYIPVLPVENSNFGTRLSRSA